MQSTCGGTERLFARFRKGSPGARKELKGWGLMGHALGHKNSTGSGQLDHVIVLFQRGRDL